MPFDIPYSDIPNYGAGTGSDNSNSGAISPNPQQLIDSMNNSSEGERDSNWWSRTWDSIKGFFNTLKDEFQYSSNPIAYEKKNSNPDYNIKDINDLLDIWDSVYTRYNKDYEDSVSRYNEWQEKLYKNYWVDQIKGMREAGINPLLAIQSLSGPSIPSGAYGKISSYNMGNLLGSYSSLLGQDKQLGSSMIKLLTTLLLFLA